MRIALVVTLALGLGAVGAANAGAASAEPANAAQPQPQPQRPAAAPSRTSVDPAQRDKQLQPGWRTSEDLLWTVSGDGSGFHVLRATARSGYAWETVTTLAEPGFEVDQWIGNACLTGSGRRLVVVYGPRTFTNKPDLFDRGGFTAVVDLLSGAVVKLKVQTSLAYFNPGCGAGETAVVTQLGGERADEPGHAAQSRLFTVDAAAGKLSAPILLRTEATSAVPVGDGIVAAGGGRLLRVTPDGRTQPLNPTTGVAFRLTADGDGGLLYLERAGERVRVRHSRPVAGAAATTLAEGGLLRVGLTSGAGGRVFITGQPETVASLPSGVRALDVPRGTQMSSLGAVALTRAHQPGLADGQPDAGPPDAPRRLHIEAEALATGASLSFEVRPGASGARAAAGRAVHPALKDAGGARRSSPGTGLGSPTDPVEEERWCSVPRNHPRNQAMQPKPRQVEWAVDQAITKSLNVVRPPNWKSLGMPTYSPQDYFRPVDLEGGGRIPAQIMLGIVAQESNMWQAARFALPGVTANPLIGNFYGRNIYNNSEADDWDIRWADSDCGYGVAQITDGMRLAGREKPNEVALPWDKQRAVALDFAANVAAGVKILQEKWNQTRGAGLKVNNGDPAGLENWFFAVWAYNTGFYPDRGDGSPWGVGWANNPINPRYDQQRAPFLEDSYDDARTPQKWPYPEKVLGWAGHPIELNESPDTLVHGYRAAWWTSVEDRRRVKPPLDLFCNSTNNCQPGGKFVPDDPDVLGEPAGPCYNKNPANNRYDLKCWFHEPVLWKGDGVSCNTCGNEVLRFDPGYAYQDDATSYPPKCDLGGLPAGARIVDNVPDGTPSIRPNCSRQWTNAGTFGFNFAADAAGYYPSKVDLHQIGGGFGGHLWRSHTRKAGDWGGKLRVTGTWTPTPMTGWTRILVSVPDHGAWTRQADYVINLGNGTTRHRVVNQAWRQHRWIDIGVFNLAGNASVSLTNVASDGTGDDAIVFDAVAFVPTSRPSAFYVAMGDSYSSGEGVEPYDANSDYVRSDGDKNACHRSQQGAYPRMVTLPGHSASIAQEAANGTAAFAFIACAGAKTTSVTNDAVNNPPTADDTAGHTDWGRQDQRYMEVAQVDQGYLDADTTHVTISIGGNDARFTDILFGCTLTITRCYDPNYRLTRRNGVVDPQPLNFYQRRLIQEWLPAHLRATYRAIHAKAPNAKIFVVGYPQMFPDFPTNGCLAITPDTQHFLNVMGGLLTLSTAKAVADVRASGVDITFVDPTPAWRNGTLDNSHWACPTDPSGTWTNAIIASSETGSGKDTPGTGSFHPKRAGQNQLASLVSTALRGASSDAAVQQRILQYVAGRSPTLERWTVTPAQALYAAQRCLELTRIGGVVGDPCMTMPIMLPSVVDANGAARNDLTVINRNPPWVRLNYVSSAEMERIRSRSWMDVGNRQDICPSPRGTGLQCDEYPFFSSELATIWDDWGGQNSAMSTGLSLIPAGENGREGNVVGRMYTECGMTGGTYLATALPVQLTNGDPYLTIPLTETARATPQTMFVC